MAGSPLNRFDAVRPSSSSDINLGPHALVREKKRSLLFFLRQKWEGIRRFVCAERERKSIRVVKHYGDQPSVLFLPSFPRLRSSSSQCLYAESHFQPLASRHGKRMRERESLALLRRLVGRTDGWLLQERPFLCPISLSLSLTQWRAK